MRMCVLVSVWLPEVRNAHACVLVSVWLPEVHDVHVCWCLYMYDAYVCGACSKK